ncbi:MAG TPA: amidohydrolase [Roseiflexaceae bacterium]|nr:amidohydrolase [Roseiflexaceae bacterium]
MPVTVLYNGPIYTLDPAQPRAQAIAVRDGRVVAVGSEGKVYGAVGGRGETINLQGRAVIPALTDAHVHLIWHALARRTVRLDDVADFDEALRRIEAAARGLPPGAWLQGGGWDHTRWGGRWPTAEDLDRVAPDRPALLSRKDGHSAWVNSRALEIAGIGDDTPDPPGGAIRREKGRATGILQETAIDLARRHVPDPSEAERLAAVEEAIAEAHSYGMAGMHLPTSMRPGDGALHLADLQTLRARGRLRLRCLAYLGLDALDQALALGVKSGLGDAWLRIGGVKLFADGSLGSETAEMLEHYEGRRHFGLPVMPVEELNDCVRRAIHGGLSVCVHAIGDAANRKVLDAIEAALQIEDSRLKLEDSAAAGRAPASSFKLQSSIIPNRIEHCQVLHPRDIPRFARLGVVASMQPIHCTSDMETADRLWGERCTYAYAWRALRDAGAVLAFGSDAPVEPLNPWLGVHAAVTRQRPGGVPAGGWHPEQRLTVEEALLGFTAGAACAAGMERELGALVPGKLADLTVLSADPFKLSPSELHTVCAELTMIEGDVVWERKG